MTNPEILFFDENDVRATSLAILFAKVGAKCFYRKNLAYNTTEIAFSSNFQTSILQEPAVVSLDYSLIFAHGTQWDELVRGYGGDKVRPLTIWYGGEPGEWLDYDPLRTRGKKCFKIFDSINGPDIPLNSADIKELLGFSGKVGNSGVLPRCLTAPKLQLVYSISVFLQLKLWSGLVNGRYGTKEVESCSTLRLLRGVNISQGQLSAFGFSDIVALDDWEVQLERELPLGHRSVDTEQIQFTSLLNELRRLEDVANDESESEAVLESWKAFRRIFL